MNKGRKAAIIILAALNAICVVLAYVSGEIKPLFSNTPSSFAVLETPFTLAAAAIFLYALSLTMSKRILPMIMRLFSYGILLGVMVRCILSKNVIHLLHENLNSKSFITGAVVVILAALAIMVITALASIRKSGKHRIALFLVLAVFAAGLIFKLIYDGLIVPAYIRTISEFLDKKMASAPNVSTWDYLTGYHGRRVLLNPKFWMPVSSTYMYLSVALVSILKLKANKKSAKTAK